MTSFTATVVEGVIIVLRRLYSAQVRFEDEGEVLVSGREQNYSQTVLGGCEWVRVSVDD